MWQKPRKNDIRGVKNGSKIEPSPHSCPCIVIWKSSHYSTLLQTYIMFDNSPLLPDLVHPLVETNKFLHICNHISFLFSHWGHYHLKLYYPIGNTAQLFFILSHVASSLISPWWDPKKLADSWWSTHPTATFYLSFFSFCLIWNGSTKPSLQAVSNKTTDSRFMG